MNREHILVVRNVEVVFKVRSNRLFGKERVRALGGVSTGVPAGGTLGIVGESGSGKSTLAKVLVGLQTPTIGEIFFRGEPRLIRKARDRRAFGRSVAMVFQDASTALNSRLTVHDAIADPLVVHGIGNRASRSARVRELLHLVGLPPTAAEVVPSQVSGGQRQRVAIARALALEPEVLVADEPTSALDVSVRAQILNLLADLKAELGLSMVFISHDIQTIRYVSDEVIVMNHGEIVEQGKTESVFLNPQHAYTETLLSAAPRLLESGGDGVLPLRLGHGT